MNIEKKLEQKINTIIQLTGEYPNEIEITEDEYKQLTSGYQEACLVDEILDKNGQPLNKFMGIKLKIKK